MRHTVTSNNLIQLYGIDGVTYFPWQPQDHQDAKTAEFLSSVGLPHDVIFTSRAEVEASNPDPIEVGALFDLDDRPHPPECRRWIKLGYLTTGLLTIDPISGKIYAFPEGEIRHHLLHRDIESLVFCLRAFRKLNDAYPESDDVEALVDDFKYTVRTFDPTPFHDEDSEWNRIAQEVLDGIW